MLPIAGWSSLVARRAHNPKVRGSNPLPATNEIKGLGVSSKPFLLSFSTILLKIQKRPEGHTGLFTQLKSMCRTAKAKTEKNSQSARCPALKK
jgi:hypothetical protein